MDLGYTNEGNPSLEQGHQLQRSRSLTSIRVINLSHSDLQIATTLSSLSSPGTTLIIGDSVTRHLEIQTNHTTVQKHCFPGARVIDIAVQNPMVLNHDKKVDTVVLHAGVNNISLRQSEILKKDFNELVEAVRNTLPGTRILISGQLPTYRRGNEYFSRLFALNNWLESFCKMQNLGFINNWDLFWE